MTTFRKIALTAGIGYLIIFFTGIFSNFFILEKLVVPDDGATTLTNITDNAGPFRLGMLSFIFMVLFDLVLTWALFLLLEHINRNLALFMAWFRLVNCAVFGVALFHLFDVLELASASPHLAQVPTEYLQAEVMRSLVGFNYTWLLGLLFFGIHLVALGALALQSGYIPRFIGYLLFLAGAGYLADSFAQFMLANYADYKDVFTMIVLIPGVAGELSFTVWLLLRGGRNHPLRH